MCVCVFLFCVACVLFLSASCVAVFGLLCFFKFPCVSMLLRLFYYILFVFLSVFLCHVCCFRSFNVFFLYVPKCVYYFTLVFLFCVCLSVFLYVMFGLSACVLFPVLLCGSGGGNIWCWGLLGVLRHL